MSATYDPSKWYWYVGGDTSKAYSSAAGDYVPVSDAAFSAWLGGGNTATPIDSEASLAEILASASARPVNTSILSAYQAVQASEIATSPAFKPIFYLMKQVATLQGAPAPTASQAIDATKGLL